MEQVIFIINGPPAAGKTTLSAALLARFPRGLHIPVDDLREWVVSGLASTFGWNEETTRQFALAEEAAADLAVRYYDSGFAIAIDHCQAPTTLDTLCANRFLPRRVIKIAVVPPLELNLRRNRERTNKGFEPDLLVKSIEGLNPKYLATPIHEQGWIVITNEGSLEQTVEEVLGHLSSTPTMAP